MSMHQESQQRLTFEQVLDAHVAAGKMVGFNIRRWDGSLCYPVSQRAAVWLLQALEGKLESYEPDAVTEGRAVEIEYQYGSHRSVLGTYSGLEIYDFSRGIMHYCKRKWKDAERQARRAKRGRLAAEKGGATL